ncbi:putative molybdopterin biosynthesis protein [Planifilum fulgidum]|uniref:Molybdopterin molybdenumtransferase n=1 Tax=Planifilum fulgidum TaxID=201973 RepID=A0A1I2NJF8_9BACL|nr:molybdopterin biosynthesis protein [Planifilum fulgidum]SFG03733.1 putative molybdopterin biosynthesis protein [Planifilum fulgidum]
MDESLRKQALGNMSLAEARERLLLSFRFSPQTERVPVPQARGRVTAEPVYARLSMPPFPAAAMDGIAVRADRTRDASPARPLRLEEGVDCHPVDTGDPLPQGMDAVIRLERIRRIDGRTVEIREPAVPWKHVRSVGEDVAQGEMILPAHHRIRPVDLGVLLAGGVTEVPVISKPRVAVLPTGSELVPPGRALKRGEIFEFNGAVFSAYLEEWGAEPDYRGIVRDDPELLKRAILEAAEGCDWVVVNAGSSVGSEDYTHDVVRELGEVILHGVATSPGSPVLLGKVRNKPVIGLPGYPVAAYLALEWFVRPLIDHWFKVKADPRPRLRVRLEEDVRSKEGREHFVRVSIGRIGDRYAARPLPRGAGSALSLARADGLLRIPARRGLLRAGEEVEAELLRPKERIDRTLWVAGGQDPVLELLVNRIRRERLPFSLSTAGIGSLRGLHSLARGGCHMAAIHLGDEGDGVEHRRWVRRFLPGKEVLLLRLAARPLGWLVAKGNPAGFSGAEDLSRRGIRFINRQEGSGTRLFLDRLLRENGIDPSTVDGYDREVLSPWEVAAAVEEGSADVGLGTPALARRFGLDFLPLRDDPFDLVIPLEVAESEAGRLLIELVRSDAFRAAAASLEKGGLERPADGHGE